MSARAPAGRRLALELLDDAGRRRAALPIDEDEVVLGRDVIARLGAGADPAVSRRHARVFRRGDGFAVADLGSRNGTTLNGAPVPTDESEGSGGDRGADIAPGDVIQIGAQRFRLAAADYDLGEPAAWLDAATVAATRADAPERLRLVYDLSRIASQPLASAELLPRLCEMLERALRPAALCAWLPGDDAPRHGDASTLPVAADEIAACVRTQERVLRLPPAPAACRCVAVPLAGADPEDAGALAVAAAADRPFAEDDVAFVIAAAALAGQALRQSQRVSRLSVAAGDDTIVGESEPVARARREVDLVAPHADVSVLLVGETGTGKELFARRLHHASGRPGPFVAVNVAAIPAELLESELFGHVKGAFTGATAARTGFFEHAHRGTLFLDEIGEMPKALQAKLLRVSQERRIQRVGDSRSIEVDVRFVAATNADLPARIAANDFRSDLYYRLAGKQVDLPPLRARPGDVALLVRAFLARQGAGPRRVEREAMELLERYAWPGNVRQLESTMRLAAIHAAADGASAIGPEHIDARVRREAAAGVAPVATPSAAGDDAPTTGADPSLADELAAFERALVVKALRRSGGNKREAARRLTWSINTLRDRIERHHIDEGEYRGAASED